MKSVKKLLFVVLALTATALVAACSSSDGDNNDAVSDDEDTTKLADGKTLVAYFSAPLPSDVDGVTAATDIVSENGSNYGAARYLAMLIARTIQGDTLRIQCADGYYPVNYSDLASFARNERDNGTHPTLVSRQVKMSDYNNIIIVTPIWWYTVPMPIYSFLDLYDLGGKHVFIATTHAGSGAADALSVVRQEEPDADVSSNVFSIRASQVSASTSSSVASWLQQIGMTE